MAQDLKDLFSKQEKFSGAQKLPENHEERFLARLDERLPQKKRTQPNFYFLKIAAFFIVSLSVGFFVFQYSTSPQANVQVVEGNKTEKTPAEKSSTYLSNVSPEFKKIEDYYMGNINAELARLTITEENKSLIDSFMGQLSELDKEYERLNTEIKENGINQDTVSALINNLELRLELLYKLKNKLKEIKTSELEDLQNNKI